MQLSYLIDFLGVPSGSSEIRLYMASTQPKSMQVRIMSSEKESIKLAVVQAPEEDSAIFIFSF